MSTRKSRRRSRRRRSGQAPLWAPTPLGVPLEKVHPVPGWVMVQEYFDQDRVLDLGETQLEVVSMGIPNTVYGHVVGIHAETAQGLGVGMGDLVVYREWEGGRWDALGMIVLLLEARHVLARCVAVVE